MTTRPSKPPEPGSAAPDNMLSPALLSRWQGLPLGWFTTPAGVWKTRFVAPHGALALLDTGCMRTRFRIGDRTRDIDVHSGGFGLFGAGIEVGVEQAAAFDARRILLEIDTDALVRRGLCDDELAQPLQHSQFFDDAPLAAVLRQMLHEVREGCPNGALFAESLSLGVALHLRRTRAVKADGAGERGKLDPWQWARLEELVDHSLASDLSLTALAAAVGLSKPHFVRMFRNTTGMSPHRYVMQKRAERALHLMQCSSLPLADIALEVGFANQGHLNRVFLHRYGMTPGEARRQARR
ncbi:helix-turn-helix domain-containing protein [Variovorax sp. YR566]|uniref:helix-turn-helix domain-containing protein n=1 Tax=Variovorax sp. YR566 TaxID=3450237 RepID=UPI003F81F715